METMHQIYLRDGFQPELGGMDDDWLAEARADIANCPDDVVDFIEHADDSQSASVRPFCLVNTETAEAFERWAETLGGWIGKEDGVGPVTCANVARYCVPVRDYTLTLTLVFAAGGAPSKRLCEAEIFEMRDRMTDDIGMVDTSMSVGSTGKINGVEVMTLTLTIKGEVVDNETKAQRKQIASTCEQHLDELHGSLAGEGHLLAASSTVSLGSVDLMIDDGMEPGGW
jgi:hypothetical protein